MDRTELVLTFSRLSVPLCKEMMFIRCMIANQPRGPNQVTQQVLCLNLCATYRCVCQSASNYTCDPTYFSWQFCEIGAFETDAKRN